MHEKQQFDAIESLMDTIYEDLAKSIDMHKGLLNPLNDVSTPSWEVFCRRERRKRSSVVVMQRKPTW